MKTNRKTHFLKATIGILAAGVVIFSGCTEDIKDDVKKLQGDVEELNSLKEVVENLKNSIDAGAVISSIENPYTDANGTGIKINYTGNKAPSIIYNGKTGAAGAAGKTPVMTIDAQGYWCVDGVRAVPNVMAKGVNGNSVKVTQNADKSVTLQVVDAAGANVGSPIVIPAPVNGTNGKSVTAVKNPDGTIDIFEVVNGVNGTKLATIPAPINGTNGTNGTGFDVDVDGLTITITPINADGTKGNPSIVTVKNGVGVKATTNNDGSVTIQNLDDNGQPTGEPTTIYQPKAPTITSGTTENGMLKFIVTNYKPDGSVESTNEIITTVPTNNDYVITGIVQNGDYYSFITNGGGTFDVLGKVARDLPQSISVLSTFIALERDGQATFKIRVNPSNAIDLSKDMIALDYVKNYIPGTNTRAAIDANAPDYCTIAKVELANKDSEGEFIHNGEYNVTIQWKDAYLTPEVLDEIQCVFIVATFKDHKQKDCSITSATPVVIVNDFEYVTADDIKIQEIVTIFQDETYNGELLLSDGVQKKNIVVDANSVEATGTNAALVDVVFNPETFMFTVKAKDDAFSGLGADKFFEVDLQVSFYDEYDTEKTYEETTTFIKIKVFKVEEIILSSNSPTAPAYNMYIPHLEEGAKFGDSNIKTHLQNRGYNDTQIAAATVKSNSYKFNGEAFDNAGDIITPSFNNGIYGIQAAWTVLPGKYEITTVLSIGDREIRVIKTVTVKIPVFNVSVKSDVEFEGGVVYIKKDVMTATASVKVTDILDGTSCLMVEPQPNQVYQFVTEGVLAGAYQGLRATSDVAGAVTASEFKAEVAADWNVEKTLYLNIKLKSGQVIPVQALQSDKATKLGANGEIKAKFVNVPVKSLTVNNADIAYNSHISTDFDLSTLLNQITDIKGNLMQPNDTRIKSIAYVASASDPVMNGKALVTVTGKNLRMVDNFTWPAQILNIPQAVVVTVTDIWGVSTTATITLTVYNREIDIP